MTVKRPTAEAPSHGQSIIQYDKRSKGAKAYISVADEIQQRVGAWHGHRVVQNREEETAT